MPGKWVTVPSPTVETLDPAKRYQIVVNKGRWQLIFSGQRNRWAVVDGNPNFRAEDAIRAGCPLQVWEEEPEQAQSETEMPEMHGWNYRLALKAGGRGLFIEAFYDEANFPDGLPHSWAEIELGGATNIDCDGDVIEDIHREYLRFGEAFKRPLLDILSDTEIRFANEPDAPALEVSPVALSTNKEGGE